MKRISLLLLLIGSVATLIGCTEENINPLEYDKNHTNSAHGVVVHDEF